MERAYRILGFSVPVAYLIMMSVMVEQKFPGWAKHYYSLELGSVSERLFLAPTIIFMVLAWKLPRRWLAYMLLVQLLIFVPAVFQMLQKTNQEHHPWLGLGGLYQLVWMLFALVIAIAGRWIGTSFKKRSAES